MKELNEVLRRWNAIQDIDKERELFDAYSRARNGYLKGLADCTTGKIRRKELTRLFEAERVAFSSYVEHRTKIKPAGD